MKGPVVADAGPVHYLILVDCINALPNLFEVVLIPPAVRDELLHSSAPQKVKDFISSPPAWIKMELSPRIHSIAGLHKGETEVLHLALQTKTPSVLMDDLDGRTAARQLGLVAIGTIGILEGLAQLQLIDLPATIAKLRQTNFFIGPELLDAALERDRRRRLH